MEKTYYRECRLQQLGAAGWGLSWGPVAQADRALPQTTAGSWAAVHCQGLSLGSSAAAYV